MVTVLFADLVGFTGLSEQKDPEQVKHLIDRCFQRLVADITAFGGTVDKIFGDAIVALFGAPTAHEDDAERAVRAALRMQRTIGEMGKELHADIRMRVGVNTGEVVVGAIRAGGDYTAMGDTVNVASRLEGLAEPGQVLVGPTTAAATRDAIRYEQFSSIVIRGRDEALDVYTALEELAPPGRRHRTVRAPLVGRNLELLQLTAAIDATVARRRAHLIMLLGEAGVGKTRLAAEVAAAAEATHDAMVLEGRVLPYGETNPFRSMAEALRSVLGVEPTDAPDTAGDRVRTRVEGALADTEDLEALTRVTNGLLHLLGYESPVAGFEPTRAREEVTWAVQQFLRGCTARRPVILVLGDVNWADQRLLELVDHLLSALASAPLVVITTARWSSDDDDRWRPQPGRHNTSVVNLDALDLAGSARLLRSLLGQEASDEVIELLHDRAGGNPFFLEELAGLLAEAGVLGGDAGSVDTRLGGLPDTLRGLVAARIDALSPEQRAMVEDAAIVGRTGPVYALLLMAKQRGHEDGEYTYNRLTEKDVLEPGGRGWRFRSDMVREVTYSMMTKTVRAEKHRGVADWLADHYDEAERGESSAGLIARHYRAAADLLSEMGRRDGAELAEKAIHWLIVAGHKADAHDSNYAAATFFAQAFDLLGSEDARRVGVSLGRARARLSLRELAGARADAEAALELAGRLGDAAGEAGALSVLGQAASAQGEHERADELLTTAIARWSDLGNDAELAEVLRLRGMAAMQEGQFDHADEDFAAALGIFTTIGDAGGQAWCQQSLAWMSFELGRIAEAERRLERALDLFTRIDDAQGLTFSNGLLAFLRLHQGRTAEAERLATDTLAEASERGERFGEAMMLLLLASLQLWSGRARSAVEGAQAARELFERIENQYGVIQSLGLMARADSALGNIDRSRAELESVIALAGRLPGGTLDAFAQLVAAGSAVQQGDGARALAMLEPSPADAPAPADEPAGMLGVLDREVSRSLALLQTGCFDEAMKLLEGISPGITADSGPLAYFYSTMALALAVHGRDDEALSLADTVLSGEQCTYLDRRAANIAEGLIHARRGDADAVAAVFARAISEIDATDSRTSQAVVRLAHAVALEALGSPEAGTVRRDAEERFADIDLDGHGWTTVFTGVTVGPFDLPAKS